MEPAVPHLIAVPFHDGLPEVDRGRGPGALLAAAGIAAAETIAAPDPGEPEAARVFTIAARLAERVRGARAAGAFPLVLAGDCNSCLGTVAGCGTDGRLARSRVRVVPGGPWSEARAPDVLDGLRRECSRVYPAHRPGRTRPARGVANRYSAPGGLGTAQLLRAIALVADRFEIAAAAITAYEPAADTDGRMARTAGRVLAALMGLGPR